MELLQLKGPQITFEPNKKLEYLKNAMLITYVVLETLYKTIFGKYLAVEMERLQCVVGAVLACLLLIEWFRLDKDNKIKWIKRHALVFVYFAIRVVTFVSIGFQYTMLRSVFFEVIYLFVLTELVLSYNLCKRILVKGFILINFILNIITIFMYHYTGHYYYRDIFLFDWIYEISVKYTDILGGRFGSMYSNPNFMGMFTGLAIIIALNYIPKCKDNKKKILLGLYFAFSIYCVWLSNCSNAYVALMTVAIAAIIVKKTSFFTKKSLTITCLICCVLATSCAYFIAAINDDSVGFTDFETKLDTLSTNRYAIWKDSYYSHQDEALLGCGNLTLEKRDRYQYNLDKGIDLGLDVNSSLVDYVGPHNGYVGMLSCTGILGFIAYLAVVIKKILDSKSLNKGYWYLAIIFILMINLFECMVIINKNALCMYMFLILAMDDREETA